MPSSALFLKKSNTMLSLRLLTFISGREGSNRISYGIGKFTVTWFDASFNSATIKTVSRDKVRIEKCSAYDK